ncbi:TorD/DmsD family molecular chaperone [Aidingimonas lacisalsi]|uniref:TorD/DmsD family molecular chaperone n=1 Tax=Aidingimonas lacisalsi TaxID=2604086 RepID=UPI0011D282EA|nr:molecular chaperone TorD family protein [Aidingimonas lacisalsi]
MNDLASTDPMPELSDIDGLRTDVYRLLANCLLTAPDRELLTWLAELQPVDDGSTLFPCWEALSEAAGQVSPEPLQRAHFRHLIGVIEGDVIPYASWYRNGTLMDEALVTLRQELRYLGFEKQEGHHDPEDHLAALCEVMAMLIESSSVQQAGFFMRHLEPWAATCFNDLANVDTPFYASIGDLGQTFMRLEADRLSALAGHEPIRLTMPSEAGQETQR